MQVAGSGGEAGEWVMMEPVNKLLWSWSVERGLDLNKSNMQVRRVKEEKKNWIRSFLDRDGEQSVVHGHKYSMDTSCAISIWPREIKEENQQEQPVDWPKYDRLVGGAFLLNE